MTKIKWIYAYLCLLMGLSFGFEGRAEVVEAFNDGFLIKHSVIINAAPSHVYNRFIHPKAWWDPQHTWSGQAKNLTMVAKAGGCFCESLDGGGSVMHMSIVFVDPGKSMRLHGSLGPLQMEGVSGSMMVEFQPISERPDQTLLSLSYGVGGYRKGGLTYLAPLVDQVLGNQIQRLKLSFDPGFEATN